MQYQVVYDAATLPFRYPRPALLGVLPLAIGLVMVRAPTLWFERMPAFGRLFGAAVSTFGLALVVGLPLAVWHWNAEVHRRLAHGEYTTVEGTVMDFEPGQASCHPSERFTVAGHAYEYCPYDQSGFNQVSTQGGPIRAGVHVRIADIDGNIQRLEIGP